MTILRNAARTVWRLLTAARIWFRDWRRTRPFWGGLWAILAGAWIIHTLSFTLVVTLAGNGTKASGDVLGGGMILFGLLAWLAPYYRGLCGIAAFLLALAAFPTANLGGYLLGTVLGLLGGSMIWAWGEKRPGRKERRAAAARPSEPSDSGESDMRASMTALAEGV